jgi:hypothetical protein
MDEKNPQKPEPPPIFDLGHRGDVNYTQIERQLKLTPTQRLDRHEGWRLIANEALAAAMLRARDDGRP